ncbi:hypothetical protein ATEIFO6365_0003041300 [Aspergillus terreus]|uniref:Uncharacterized protein n=1 Tax=Aspergillus terreus TaxID=33178 RepID=A0A5M3YRK6_ASPTE|nr:hypothetical protein ATETN484_0003035800 [Aspergillus terreus]GFF14347.1 hypothetical protein ATEIFO6365_0003041300 [Aspergillus terreus]
MADAHRKRPQPDDPQPSTTSRPNMTTSLSHRSRPCPGQQSDRNEFSHPSAAAAVAAGNASDDEDDFTSSSGSDSSDDESDDDGEEGQSGDEHDQGKSDDGRDQALPRIPARQKPRIQHVERDGDLLARISAFLPQMKNANDELQREIEAGRAKEIRLDEVDDQNEGQYIEMNLGLGVLEEKRQGDDSSDNASDEDLAKKTSAGTNADSRTDSNVLGKLMGQEDASSSNKPTIEEMKE